MKQKKVLIIVFTLLLLGGGLALWNAQRQVGGEPETASETPVITGERVSFVVTEGEVKKWRLLAKQAVYNESHTEADLIDISGEFYDVSGKPVMEFQAPKGHFTNESNAVVLTGGVVVRSLDDLGGILKAPRMTWSESKEDVVAEGGVEMIYPDLGKSNAEIARFALDFSSISLEGNVRSEITPNE